MADPQDNKAEMDKIMGRLKPGDTSGDSKATGVAPTTATDSTNITLTPEQHADAVKHTTTMAGVLGIGKPKEAITGTDSTGKPVTATEAVDRAVAGVKANPDPEYN